MVALFFRVRVSLFGVVVGGFLGGVPPLLCFLAFSVVVVVVGILLCFSCLVRCGS